MTTGSRHAKLAQQYWAEAALDAGAWKNWQFKAPDEACWDNCNDTPLFRELLEYRRKLKTIRIGEYDVPEPLRSVKEGQLVWVASTTAYAHEYMHFSSSASHHRRWLQNGLMHATEEASQMHIDAMMSFSRSKE
jgi:hypothetical protein